MMRFFAVYLWHVATGVLMWPVMFWFNQTKIIGKENLRRSKNQLIIANHLTMIDSWFITMACCWPQLIWQPWLIPFHLPEHKNFLKKQPLKTMCIFWQCIPITRGSGDFLKKLPLILKMMGQGVVMIFPEGTRNPNPGRGRLHRWTNGTALLAAEGKPFVQPVAIYGIEKILPIGSTRPRWNQPVTIFIGKGIDLNQSKFPMQDRGQIARLFKNRLQSAMKAGYYLHNCRVAERADARFAKQLSVR